MMQPVARISGRGTDASAGEVVWSPAKSLWNMSMLGHSVGMHRRFIHRSYSCKKWLERTLVYIGVLVDVAGPFGILRVHDERDWAQRQRTCHNNHHAFPESARIGLERGQTDPAAWVIEALARLGWTWNLGVPREHAERDDLSVTAR